MLKGVITVVTKFVIDRSGNSLTIGGQNSKNPALKRFLKIHHTRALIYHYFLTFCLACDIKLTTRTTTLAYGDQGRVCIKIGGAQVLVIAQHIDTVHIGTTRQN